jgi:anaerobic selenocysteine-containing dehydrogenase
MATTDCRFFGLEGVVAGTSDQPTATGGMSPPAAEQKLSVTDDGHLQLLPIYNLLGSGVLAANSPTLDVVRAAPHIIISATDAELLNISDGETVVMQSTLGKMHIEAKVDDRAVAGLVLLPYFDRAASGAFLPGAGTFSCRLLKEDL